MPAKLPQSFLFSLFIHGLLFIGVGSFFIKTNPTSHYSKNLGTTQIRAVVRVEEYKPKEKKKVVKKSKKKVAKKKIQKKRKEQKATRAKGKVDTGQTSALATYLTKVREEIVKNKYKSRIAEKLGLKGAVKLSFSIAFPNIVKDIKVISSSKYKSLDTSAIKTVEMTDNIPTIPEIIKRKEIEVLFIIDYK